MSLQASSYKVIKTRNKQTQGWARGKNGVPKTPEDFSNRFRFLELPAEIRGEILKLLLWQAIPIRKIRLATSNDELLSEIVHEKNYKFYPQVLRVCRQIREEGEPHLYDNILCISTSFWYSKPLILDKTMDDYISSSLLYRFKKIHIEHYIAGYDQQSYPLQIDERESRNQNMTFFLLGSQLKDVCLLETLSITVKKGARTFAADNQIGEKFLEPLGVLRGLKSVTIQGVSKSYAKSLIRLMTSNTKSDNVVQELEFLRKATYHYVDDDPKLRKQLLEAHHYLSNWSLEGFYKTKDLIIDTLVQYGASEGVEISNEAEKQIFAYISESARNLPLEMSTIFLDRIVTHLDSEGRGIEVSFRDIPLDTIYWFQRTMI